MAITIIVIKNSKKALSLKLMHYSQVNQKDKKKIGRTKFQHNYIL